jgi:hypothetical protein
MYVVFNLQEKNHPVLHDMLKQKQFDTMESLMSKVETLAQGVVKKEGKQFSISVMLELPPSEKELKMLAEEDKIAQGGFCSTLWHCANL